MNTAREDSAGAGISTAGLAFGGATPTITAITEDWNGVSWAEVADLATARKELAGAGTSTNALAFGGEAPPQTAATEEWNSVSNTTKTVSTD